MISIKRILILNIIISASSSAVLHGSKSNVVPNLIDLQSFTVLKNISKTNQPNAVINNNAVNNIQKMINAKVSPTIINNAISDSLQKHYMIDDYQCCNDLQDPMINLRTVIDTIKELINMRLPANLLPAIKDDKCCKEMKLKIEQLYQLMGISAQDILNFNNSTP